MWSASSCSIFLASWAQSQDILQVAVCVGFDGWVCEFAFVDPAAFFLECQLCSCHWRLPEKRLYAGPCSVYTPPSKNKKDLPLQTISSRPYPWVCGHAQTLHVSLRLFNWAERIGELFKTTSSISNPLGTEIQHTYRCLSFSDPGVYILLDFVWFCTKVLLS